MGSRNAFPARFGFAEKEHAYLPGAGLGPIPLPIVLNCSKRQQSALGLARLAWYSDAVALRAMAPDASRFGTPP